MHACIKTISFLDYNVSKTLHKLFIKIILFPVLFTTISEIMPAYRHMLPKHKANIFYDKIHCKLNWTQPQIAVSIFLFTLYRLAFSLIVTMYDHATVASTATATTTTTAAATLCNCCINCFVLSPNSFDKNTMHPLYASMVLFQIKHSILHMFQCSICGSWH